MKRKKRVLHVWLLIGVALIVCVYSLFAYRRRGVEVMRKSSAQMLDMLAAEKKSESVNHIDSLSTKAALLKSMSDSGEDAAFIEQAAATLGFDGVEISGEAQGDSIDIRSGRLAITRQTAQGAITCYIDAENTRRIFDSPDDETRFYSFLTDSAGNILSTADHDGFLNISNNTVDFYSEAILYDGVKPSDVSASLESGGSGNLTYSYGSRSNNVSWIPLGINDWTLFVAATSELNDAGERDINRRVLELGVTFAIGILLLAAAFMLKIIKLHGELTKSNADCNESRAVMAQLKDISFTILFECDLKTGVIDYNESFERQLGRKPNITNFSMLLENGVDPRLRDMALEMKRGVPKGKVSVQLNHANGAPIWYQIYYVCVYGKNETAPSKVVGRIANIEWHDHEQDAQTAIVEHDALTGLLGHTAFMRRAEKQAGAKGRECAMMTIDIDDFKIVSRSENKYSGDELIVRMSEAMRRTFPSSAIMGRISGDVFAVILTGDVSNERLAQSAVSLEKEFEKTGCTCSIGIAASDGSASIAELCSRSDKALYRAKLLGKNGYQFFDTSGESDIVTEDDTDANALLFKCVTSIATIKDLNESLRYVLKQTAKFYDASYANIILCDDAESRFAESNIYAREKAGDTPKLTFSYLEAPNIVKALKEHKPLSIFDSSVTAELPQCEADIIKRRGEKAVYLVPLGDVKAQIGFLGIINPKYHVGNVSFMRTLATCIGCDIEKRRNTK